MLRSSLVFSCFMGIGADLTSNRLPAPAAYGRITLAQCRTALLVLLLAAEITHLGLPVLSSLKGNSGQWWWLPVANGRAIAEAVLCASFVIVLLTWPAFVGELRANLAHLNDTDRNRWLALHLACATLFAGWLWIGTSSGQLPPLLGTLWFLSGVAISTATAWSWCAALLPFSFWCGWFAQSRGSFAVGALIGFTARAAGYLAQALWQSLRDSTFSTVVWMLRVLGEPIVIDRSQSLVGTNRFTVSIAPICSGFEGIGLIVVFLTVYLWYSRKELRFPHAFLLLPIGIATIWFFNAARITALILIGGHFSRFALLGFHTVAGWIFFNCTAIGLVIASRRTNLFTKTENPRLAATANPAAPYLVPLIIMLATSMISGGFFAQCLDLAYPLTVLLTGSALWIYRRRFENPVCSFNWPAVLLGAIAAIPLLILHPQSAPIEADLLSLPRSLAVTWIAFWLVGAIIITPLAEELAFRGFLMRRMASFEFQNVAYDKVTVLPILTSSILYGLLHHNWVASIASGFIYALAARRRNRLADATSAHMTSAAIIACSYLPAAMGHLRP